MSINRMITTHINIQTLCHHTVDLAVIEATCSQTLLMFVVQRILVNKHTFIIRPSTILKTVIQNHTVIALGLAFPLHHKTKLVGI